MSYFIIHTLLYYQFYFWKSPLETLMVWMLTSFAVPLSFSQCGYITSALCLLNAMMFDITVKSQLCRPSRPGLCVLSMQWAPPLQHGVLSHLLRCDEEQT